MFFYIFLVLPRRVWRVRDGNQKFRKHTFFRTCRQRSRCRRTARRSTAAVRSLVLPRFYRFFRLRLAFLLAFVYQLLGLVLPELLLHLVSFALSVRGRRQRHKFDVDSGSGKLVVGAVSEVHVRIFSHFNNRIFQRALEDTLFGCRERSLRSTRKKHWYFHRKSVFSPIKVMCLPVGIRVFYFRFRVIESVSWNEINLRVNWTFQLLQFFRIVHLTAAGESLLRNLGLGIRIRRCNFIILRSRHARVLMLVVRFLAVLVFLDEANRSRIHITVRLFFAAQTFLLLVERIEVFQH